jgi:hypothetical protein
MEVVHRLHFWKTRGRGRTIGQSKEDEANPLGKIIYYEGTRVVVSLFRDLVLYTDILHVQIGTVSHIYDSPSVRLPYPQGYRHDLALIVGPNLPTFLQPPNCAKLLPKFATPEEALKGGTVFLLNSEFHRSKPGTLDVVSDHVMVPTARDALIMGVQSTWDYSSHLEITNSLIWRSDPDDKDVGGASGSLLCLGSNADKVVKGLVFQNFEGGYPGQSWQRDNKGHESILGLKERATFKGGFFLPSEVQAGTILLDDQEETRRVFSGKGPEPSKPTPVKQK